MNRILPLLCILILLTLSAPVAHAHKVSLFAWAEGGKVQVESRFSGGRRPQNADLAVYDTQGTLLLEGKTDKQGRFEFQIPKTDELRIVLSAGSGHLAQWTLSAAEIATAMGTEPATSEAAANPPAAADTAPTESSSPATTADHTLTAAEIEQIVSETVDRKLRPLIDMMADQAHDRPSISEIIGGIGYIIGLVGLAAYIRYRRSQPKDR